MSLEVETRSDVSDISSTSDAQILLPLTSLQVRPGHNTRRRFQQETIESLAESIRRLGILQPLVVRLIDDHYEVICGERRFRAAAIAGLVEVPVTIRIANDTEAREMAMAENSQREDLTPAEEAYFAQELVDLYDGDHERAAASQGWKVDKLRHRLQLLHAIPTVLDALISDTISVSHCELLATLPSDVQAAVLPRVVEAKLTVAQLRDQLQTFSVPLVSAIFNKADCLRCAHNSAHAGQLFEAHIDAGRCSNKTCFKTKTAEELEQRRQALREDYPRVVLQSEVVAGSTIPLVKIGPSGVGEAQFQSGCLGCAHRCAIIEDRIGPAVGTVDSPVCANRACHAEKVAEYQASIAPPEADTEDSDGEETSAAGTSAPAARATASSRSKPKAKKAGNAKSPTAHSTPAAVVSQYAAVARRAVGAAVAADSKHVLAFALYGLIRSIAEDIDGSATLATVCKDIKLPIPPKGRTSGTDHEVTLVTLTMLDRDALAAAIRNATTLYINGKPEESCFRSKLKRRRFNARFVQEHAVALQPHVKVDREYLDAHTKGGIEALLVESGFKVWMEALDGGVKRYRDLIAGRKVDLIPAVLSAGFDFSTYEPKGLAKHIAEAAKS